MKSIVGQKVKIISSVSIDMKYAPDVLKFKIKEAQEEGWKRFGPMTAVYDEETDRYIVLQIMTK